MPQANRHWDHDDTTEDLLESIVDACNETEELTATTIHDFEGPVLEISLHGDRRIFRLQLVEVL